MSWTAKYWLVTFAIVAFVLLVYGAYQTGLQRGAAVLKPTDDELTALNLELDKLEQENREHRRRYDEVWAELAGARRQLQIDKATHTQLARSLDESAAFISELREQLDFYERILSPAGSTPGLRIHELEVTPASDGTEYDYRLVMVNTAAPEAPVEGEVLIEVEGRADDEVAVFDVSEIGSPPDLLRLRYFQTLEGNFRLPAGVVPQRIKVTVNARDQAKVLVEKWFMWPVG